MEEAAELAGEDGNGRCLEAKHRGPELGKREEHLDLNIHHAAVWLKILQRSPARGVVRAKIEVTVLPEHDLRAAVLRRDAREGGPRLVALSVRFCDARVDDVVRLVPSFAEEHGVGGEAEAGRFVISNEGEEVSAALTLRRFLELRCDLAAGVAHHDELLLVRRQLAHALEVRRERRREDRDATAKRGRQLPLRHWHPARRVHRGRSEGDGGEGRGRGAHGRVRAERLCDKGVNGWKVRHDARALEEVHDAGAVAKSDHLARGRGSEGDETGRGVAKGEGVDLGRVHRPRRADRPTSAVRRDDELHWGRLARAGHERDLVAPSMHRRRVRVVLPLRHEVAQVDWCFHSTREHRGP